MKAELEVVLEERAAELKKIHDQNTTMLETLSEIENTLKNYGYDASEMPDFNSDDTQNEQSRYIPLMWLHAFSNLVVKSFITLSSMFAAHCLLIRSQT